MLVVFFLTALPGGFIEFPFLCLIPIYTQSCLANLTFCIWICCLNESMVQYLSDAFTHSSPCSQRHSFSTLLPFPKFIGRVLDQFIVGQRTMTYVIQVTHATSDRLSVKCCLGEDTQALFRL